MTPENPLLAPRLLWQIALAMTVVLVAIRGLIWLRECPRTKSSGEYSVERAFFGCAIGWGGSLRHSLQEGILPCTGTPNQAIVESFCFLYFALAS